ncbi:MAG TPA: response regulator [Myxococcota bacterium]|nr:response regulator [Myxococcota bacterium]
MSLSILVVDDNRSAADGLAMVLRRHGYAAVATYDGHAAIEHLDRGGIDVVLTDMKMEPVDGLEVLSHARGLPSPPDVLVMTGYGTVDAAVRAMHLGACDFLTKPVAPAQILEQLQQLQGAGVSIRVQDGESSAAVRLREQVHAVTRVDSTVLLVGEPGCGRAQLARQIHAESSRSAEPFLVVSHPARVSSEGLQSAGMVFLPNVDLLDPTEQVQLTQLLDQVAESQATSPRLLASAAPSWAETATGEPRSLQLYYRLAVLVVHVPPLRERPDDIPTLFESWLTQRAEDLEREVPRPTPEQTRALVLHGWPGNLRELAAVAERAVVFGAAAFEIAVQPSARAAGVGLPDLVEGFSLQSHLEEVERTLLVRAIDQSGGDRSAMSRILGVERNTLRYKLNKYGLLDRT